MVKKKVVKKVLAVEVPAEPVKELIAPLDLNLGNEGLNALVGKVNEIIKKLNV